MSIQISFDDNASRIHMIDLVYQARAAQEQAEKKKLGAFGALARINPLNRPKPETVTLAKSELRYEPFWHVVARRAVDFRCQVEYTVAIENPHAQRVEVEGRPIDVASRGNKRYMTVPGIEDCYRRIDFAMHLDGLKREVRAGTLLKYATYKSQEVEQVDEAAAVKPLVPVASVLQIATSQLAREAISAHEIVSDTLTVEKLHLYWRPVYAFEYLWTTAGKTGVLEVDGLTGESAENGVWFVDKLDRVLTREMLIEASAEVANAVIPGAGLVVKLADRMI